MKDTILGLILTIVVLLFAMPGLLLVVGKLIMKLLEKRPSFIGFPIDPRAAAPAKPEVAEPDNR